MRERLPYIALYPADWLADDVAGCSLQAQGLWLRLMFLMHTSDRYGHLVKDGLAIGDVRAAQRCGTTVDLYQSLLAELAAAGVPSYTRDHVIFSRRMVRDHKRRMKAQHYGKSGGNPQLRKENRVKGRVIPPVKAGVDSSSIAVAVAVEEASGRPPPAVGSPPPKPPEAPSSTIPKKATPGRSGAGSCQHKAAGPREPNPWWDAICAEWGLHPATKAEEKRVGAWARDLRLKTQDPAIDIARVKRAYAAAYPDCAWTGDAMLRHWDEMLAGTTRAVVKGTGTYQSGAAEAAAAEAAELDRARTAFDALGPVERAERIAAVKAKHPGLRLPPATIANGAALAYWREKNP